MVAVGEYNLRDMTKTMNGSRGVYAAPYYFKKAAPSYLLILWNMPPGVTTI